MENLFHQEFVNVNPIIHFVGKIFNSPGSITELSKNNGPKYHLLAQSVSVECALDFPEAGSQGYKEVQSFHPVGECWIPRRI